ncbi:PREDICTED: disease resistance protein TAO1-like [Camelina sativa]|uniref:ADP-ribosyl cyclase/cyclic ADP-ribose hydrolase n=1 Tax=Camelina sativa TaxID=90675 RepID=A0ABM1RE80_CAMSA|nr:PREDICTED: disease resistance protein TAO1-like [Camelina sativa]
MRVDGISSRRNFSPKYHPCRPSCSVTKPPQRPSSMLLSQRQLKMSSNRGFPSFIRLPRPTPSTAAAASDGLGASYPSSVSSGSYSIYADPLGGDSRPPPLHFSLATDSQLKYDVFLSFRGPDSRENFVSHLYDDLCREGIETFVDSEKLDAGEEIEPALLDAIERSRISVVVFTKEYASSKWCLRELAKIMECRRTRGHIVLPVFLGVEPMEVRWQRGSYSVAFSRHDKAPEGSQLAEEVKEWRKAMREAANISGFDSSTLRPASKLVDEIVAHVLKNLENISLSEDEGLVGAYSQVKEVEAWLGHGLHEVRTIGICGIGGSGKTAIAGAVFNRQYQMFDSYCFLANVREQSKKHGLHALRNELLCRILGQTDINIATPEIGSSSIKNRLRRKRVLIVLDDVSSITQLEFLISKTTYYAPGSRIIVTTRDMNVIKNADEIYSLKGLSDSDSLELFSQCAFKQSYPPEEYLKLSMRAAGYAKGIPLALKVLGSFLCKKTMVEWESALRRLNSSLDEEIFNVLRVSFDGLSDEEKTTFLHLLCFFNGHERRFITDIINGCGISADICIRALVDKCMITFTNDRLQIHDLLQNMGRQMIKIESPQDPSRRSRLCSFDEVHEVLTENTGTIVTEGISLDISEKEELQLDCHAFEEMRNLKILRFSNEHCNEDSCKIHLPKGLHYLPTKLRLLHWECYPIASLPLSFDPDNLVELHMPTSRLERLWEGSKSLLNLKEIDLSNSRFLKELPDLSNAPKVERIDARGCAELVTIPSPRNKLESLEFLDLSGCSKLKDFPEISWNIRRLCLADTGILEIPPSIENFHQLSVLDMKRCKMLKNVALISKKLEKLECLDLSGCSIVTRFPEISYSVKELLLNETSIEEIPSAIKYFTKLELLELKNCLRLTGLPSSICELQSLVELNLSGCSNFISFPEITETMYNLKYLSLKGTAIRELPSSLGNLTGLCSLDLENCSNLISLPDSLLKLKSLEELNISGCSNLVSLPGRIGNLGSLVTVRASGCRSEVVDFLEGGSSSLKILDLSDCGMTEFPEALTLLSTVTELDLSQNCFSTIPASIKDLQDLQTLDLSHCHELESLLGVPTGLTRLNVINSRSLETVALSNSSELQLYPLNNVEAFVFAGCPSLSQHATDNIKTYAKRRIHVMASHLGLTLNFKSDDLSLNRWMKPQQVQYLLSTMYGYGNLHEALIGLHTAFFSDEMILVEPPPRLLGRILHDFHERYKLDVQGLLHFFSLIAHLYLYYQGKPSTNFCLPGDNIPEWFCHQSNESCVEVMLEHPKHSNESATLAGFAISVLVAFQDYNDDKGISIKYECQFHFNYIGTYEGSGYLRGWDGKKGKPLSIEGDHLFMGFDSSILFDAANGIEQFVKYSEDLVKASFQCYVIDEDGNPINSCTVKKCAIQPLLDLSHCHELESLLGVPTGLTRLNVINSRSLETVALSNSSELQLYPLNNVEAFVFAGCPSLSQHATDNIKTYAKRRIHVMASHLGLTLNFKSDDLSLNRWMKPQQVQYLLSTMYGYGNLHEALIGLHTAFFSDEMILVEPPPRLLGRILHDFHERYKLDVQGLLHFFSLIAHLYLYYQGKPSTNFCLPGDNIPEWFCHQSNESCVEVMLEHPKHSNESATLAGFAISVLVAFQDYNDDKGISIKYECQFHFNYIGTYEGSGYLRGWDGKKGKPLSIEGDHLFMGFDSSILFDAANGIEQFVKYSEDLVKASFQCYVIDEDGNPINSCTVKKCAIQPLYTCDLTKSPKEILSIQDITKGLTTSFTGFLEKVLRDLDLYGAISLGIMNVLGNLSVDVFHQGGYVYIIIKCENGGLPLGLQVLNLHLGTAPLAVKLIQMAKQSQDSRAFSIEFSNVDGGDFGCRIKVKKCEFRPLQSHIMLIDRYAIT